MASKKRLYFFILFFSFLAFIIYKKFGGMGLIIGAIIASILEPLGYAYDNWKKKKEKIEENSKKIGDVD